MPPSNAPAATKAIAAAATSSPRPLLLAGATPAKTAAVMVNPTVSAAVFAATQRTHRLRSADWVWFIIITLPRAEIRLTGSAGGGGVGWPATVAP
jgi:hypothetical protein